MKKFRILLLLIMISLIPALLNIIPISKGTGISAGSYYTFSSNSGFKTVRVTWTVTIGSGIDVFILDSAQYSSWISNPTQNPSSAVGAAYGTIAGEMTRTISRSKTYYVVYSNVNGGGYVDTEMGAYWSGGGIPGFEFMMAFIGILVLIGIALYLKKRPENIILKL